jgi:formate dehydrogenase major subunit/formate dehydrogenase alpha subunit
MVIRTDTAEVRNAPAGGPEAPLERAPASCLFCEEQTDCKNFQGTIRKVGVTTGCRYCPNDRYVRAPGDNNEVGLTETSYPVYYRNFPVEKEDPFYDRGIQPVPPVWTLFQGLQRHTPERTLSFKQRARKLTTIGPAFGRTHLEAGCEFCGACVAVCPTARCRPRPASGGQTRRDRVNPPVPTVPSVHPRPQGEGRERLSTSAPTMIRRRSTGSSA